MKVKELDGQGRRWLFEKHPGEVVGETRLSEIAVFAGKYIAHHT